MPNELFAVFDTTEGSFKVKLFEDKAPRTVENFRTTQLILTLPFVIYGLFRYQHLVMREDRGGDAGSVLFKDKGMILAVLGWGLTAAVVIYRGAL